MKRLARGCTLLAAAAALPCVAAEPFDVGLSLSGKVIEGVAVDARADAPTVLVLGGLSGDDASVEAVRAAVAALEADTLRRREVNVLAIPLANPDGAALEFPPTGAAYRDNAESHALWRWIGAHAPDLVLVAGADTDGLGAALAANAAAGVGRIPSRALAADDALAELEAASFRRSGAARELERRLERSPRELAEALARHYGDGFDPPWYIDALALIARIRLGDVNAVARLVEPYMNGEKDSLARPSALVMAGHLVFGELARATGDPRYIDMVRKVADLGFDADGAMLEALPYHNEFSDSVFMGTVIAAQAGALTGDWKYFDLAAQHLAFMQRLDLRADGLYRHQPATDAAWGRGNGFAAIGLALTLSELPPEHPQYAQVLESYQDLMAALLPHQNRDGLWRNVIDHPGAYAEFSATAMIGFAMRRGLERAWLPNAPAYFGAVENAWRAVNSRSGADGTFIDVCESTARIETLDGYLKREALLGMDDRGGAMALLFATELMN